MYPGRRWRDRWGPSSDAEEEAWTESGGFEAERV